MFDLITGLLASSFNQIKPGPLMGDHPRESAAIHMPLINNHINRGDNIQLVTIETSNIRPQRRVFEPIIITYLSPS
jgi:hypothetical protein